MHKATATRSVVFVAGAARSESEELRLPSVCSLTRSIDNCDCILISNLSELSEYQQGMERRTLVHIFVGMLYGARFATRPWLDDPVLAQQVKYQWASSLVKEAHPTVCFLQQPLEHMSHSVVRATPRADALDSFCCSFLASVGALARGCSLTTNTAKGRQSNQPIM